MHKRANFIPVVILAAERVLNTRLPVGETKGAIVLAVSSVSWTLERQSSY